MSSKTPGEAMPEAEGIEWLKGSSQEWIELSQDVSDDFRKGFFSGYRSALRTTTQLNNLLNQRGFADALRDLHWYITHIEDEA